MRPGRTGGVEFSALQHYSRADDRRSDLAATFELLDKQLSGDSKQLSIGQNRSRAAARQRNKRRNSIPLLDSSMVMCRKSSSATLPSVDNTTRAIWCLVGLRAFAQRTGITAECPGLVMSDFMGNMRHLCGALGIDFATVDDHGAEHYWYEVRSP
jgi:hypothetical protein